LNNVDRLKTAYSKHIHVPWRSDTSPEERVIFCVYNENDELRLRSRIDEFAIETRNAGHDWNSFDFTDTFAVWLANQKYGSQYFERPNLMMSAINGYRDYLLQKFEAFLRDSNADANSVVALTGVGSLFGFLKVNDVIASFSPQVAGRLIVFFPGNYENNNYRLLDAYDGWNYLAVPITTDTYIE
jgi:hypothetical protein